jgi:FtsH-binding integral membrane protein
MTTGHDGGADENPEDLPGELDRLRTRPTGRRWWFPLAVFGVLTLAPCPLYPNRAGGGLDFVSTRFLRLTDAFGGDFTGHPTAIAFYWLAALIAGFLATGLWYRYQDEHPGLRRPVPAFVITGIAITAALVVAAYVPVLTSVVLWMGLGGTSGVLVIGIALLVLARLERSWPLAGIAVLAVAVAALVTTYDVDNLLFRIGIPGGSWSQATGIVLPGLVLLLSGLVARLWPPRTAVWPGVTGS